MSDVKLRSCPFCGSARVGFEYIDDQFKDNNVFVACKACKASSAIYLKKSEAVAAWNRRPSDGHTCGECAYRDKGSGPFSWCRLFLNKCVGEWDIACCDFKKTESEEAR